MKKFISLCGMALICMSAAAQTIDEPKVVPDLRSMSYGFPVIPKDLSYDGKNRVVFAELQESDGTFKYTICSNNFDNVKTIQSKGVSLEYASVTVTQKEVLSAEYPKENYSVGGTSKVLYYHCDGEPTQEEVRKALEKNGYAPAEELYTYEGKEYFGIGHKDTVLYFSFYVESEEDYTRYNDASTQLLIETAKAQGVFNKDGITYVTYNGYTYLVCAWNFTYQALAQASYGTIDVLLLSDVKLSFEGENPVVTPVYSYYSSLGLDLSKLTDEEIKNALDAVAIDTDINGNKWFVTKQYICGSKVLNQRGYVLIDGELYESYFSGEPDIVYGDKEIEVYSDSRTITGGGFLCEYINCDAPTPSAASLHLSQTLFNTDAQYEYLSGKLTTRRCLSQVSQYGYRDVKGECNIYNDYVFLSGMSIMSESGNVLAEVDFPSNFLANAEEMPHFIVFILDGEKYILVNGCLDWECGQQNRNYASIIYHFDNGSQALVPVSAPMKISVFPTMLEQGGTVTITSDEENLTDKQVRVVDVQGRVMQKSTLPAGQQSIQMSNLPFGVNFVQILDGKASIHTQPVIVK